MTERQKDGNTKTQKDKKTERQKDEKTEKQKNSSVLFSFSLPNDVRKMIKGWQKELRWTKQINTERRKYKKRKT